MLHNQYSGVHPKEPFDSTQMSTMILFLAPSHHISYHFFPLENFICLISYHGKTASSFLPQAPSISQDSNVNISIIQATFSCWGVHFQDPSLPISLTKKPILIYQNQQEIS